MIIQQPIITSSIDGDNIKTNISGAYIGFEATSSNPTASNELVFGLGTIGYGNNTVSIGNNNTERTKLYGSIYEHSEVSSSFTASKFMVYTVTGSGWTMHMPTTPTAGDSIKISNFQTNVTGSDRFREIVDANRITIGRSGENIMGLSQNMDLDYPSPTFELIYTNTSRGWVIIGGG